MAWRVEVERERADNDRDGEASEQRESGPTEVGREVGGDGVHRPQQIGHDRARTDPGGEFGVAPQTNRGDQSLADPDVRHELRPGVSGDRSATAGGDGQKHVAAQESEHRIGKYSRDRSLAICRISPESCLG